MGENTKSYRHEVNQHKKTKRENALLIKQKDRDYSILESKFNTLKIEFDKLDSKLKLLQRGFNWYVLNDEDYIVASGQVLGGFVTTYEQVLPININNGCYKLVNGKMELDNEKYRKDRGGL